MSQPAHPPDTFARPVPAVCYVGDMGYFTPDDTFLDDYFEDLPEGTFLGHGITRQHAYTSAYTQASGRFDMSTTASSSADWLTPAYSPWNPETAARPRVRLPHSRYFFFFVVRGETRPRTKGDTLGRMTERKHLKSWLKKWRARQ